MASPVLYAKSGDISVAYTVRGSGPDLVWCPGSLSHQELWPQIPEFADVLDRAGAFARVIFFDKRGTGMSDRPEGIATLEARIDDIRAVMDAAKSERAHIFGVSEGGSMACLFAATFPERTRSLLLSTGPGRAGRALPTIPGDRRPKRRRRPSSRASRRGSSATTARSSGGPGWEPGFGMTRSSLRTSISCTGCPRRRRRAQPSRA
jgi:pimeloyl-ACP methyl ester carboxylesterase